MAWGDGGGQGRLEVAWRSDGDWSHRGNGKRVHGGCARKGWVGLHHWRTSCRLFGCSDARVGVRYITKIEKYSKIPIQGKSELARCGKKSEPGDK